MNTQQKERSGQKQQSDQHEIELGSVCRDTLTSFTGRVTAILRSLEEPDMYRTENESGLRWLPEGRIEYMRGGDSSQS